MTNPTQPARINNNRRKYWDKKKKGLCTRSGCEKKAVTSFSLCKDHRELSNQYHRDKQILKVTTNTQEPQEKRQLE